MSQRLPKPDCRTNTRRAILEAGTRAILKKGYYQCGLAEILSEADVPKGSFYYYFPSKEEFGLALIDYWREKYVEAEQTLHDETLSPLARVRGFFQARYQLFKKCKREYGTIVGTVYLEMATHNETFRQRVKAILAEWLEQLAACLVQAQKNGEIASSLDARSLAEFCLVSWEGAVQRAKTVQSITPLDLFFPVVFDNLLTAKT